jgi:transcriptional regulator of NAD metabolism
MNGEQRREKLIKMLLQSENIVSATTLAKTFGVSRQVIVQDIALLRASGLEIVSLSRGYKIEKKAASRRAFKVKHSDSDVEKELNLIVDMGGNVIDVFVFHRTYGTVRAKMGIKSRVEVQRFLKELTTGKSSLLKNVTEGYHYHTVEAENEEVLDMIEEKLRENSFLAPLTEYEPEEINKNL